MFGSKQAICQSCSMPMKLDEGHGGTEADGTHNTEYCSMCYADGQFVDPDMSLEDMQALVEDVLRKMHLPGFMAKAAVKKIPKLKRWA